MGEIAEAEERPAGSVLALGMCGCEESEDGLAGIQAALERRLEESDRFGEDSTSRRRRDPERGLTLQFIRFRNSYATDRARRKWTLIQCVSKVRDSCVENMLSTF